MKTKNLIITLFVAFNFGISSAMSIQEAIKTGKVKITMVSNGKSLEEGMLTATIQNTSIVKLDVTLPVGTKLISDENTRQNLILVNEEVMALAPNSKKSVDLKGMCIQATNQSPGNEVNYKIGEVMTGDLLTCAKMINDKKIINGCGQGAIWAFSDNHDVGWINAEKEDEIALRQFVADKKGVKNPWFTTKHIGGNNQLSEHYNPMLPTSEYYDMTGAEIKGDFGWHQNAKKKLTFAVYDERGNVLRKFFENKEFDRGEFTFKFFYKTSKNLRGTYIAKMTCGSELIQQAAFTF